MGSCRERERLHFHQVLTARYTPLDCGFPTSTTLRQVPPTLSFCRWKKMRWRKRGSLEAKDKTGHAPRVVWLWSHNLNLHLDHFFILEGGPANSRRKQEVVERDKVIPQYTQKASNKNPAGTYVSKGVQKEMLRAWEYTENPERQEDSSLCRSSQWWQARGAC